MPPALLPQYSQLADASHCWPQRAAYLVSAHKVFLHISKPIHHVSLHFASWPSIAKFTIFYRRFSLPPHPYVSGAKHHLLPSLLLIKSDRYAAVYSPEIFSSTRAGIYLL